MSSFPNDNEQVFVPASRQETPVPQRPYDENMVSKLERLGKLRQEGLLTEEEFTVAKRKVLGLE
jgi:hypothetical protein